MTRVLFSAALLAAFAAATHTASAADALLDPTPMANADTDLVIIIGAGGRFQPAYEGASETEVSPFPIIDLEYLRIPGLGQFGGKKGGGFSIGASFESVGERDSSEYDDLEGLNDVSATYQLGVKAGYEWDFAEIYGAARYAFGGAHGVVGEIGANAIFRPSAQWEIKAGPVVAFASSDYMDTYFSVTPGESINTGGRLGAYEAKGGLKSAGVVAEARYEFRPDWFVNADASYTRLVGDAADSPIVSDAGDENQFTFGLGLSKRFSLDLF
ncbi:MipA/OmpV family protein [Terrihabitans rhizophilus]|uniref:MipA/OmpV family protein n=1 Tax=Terrihabitans rhizophilus TaxID=3092662 RepID=A0ABU4RLG9_9HYPH|nr:MipA/OmpV family protein [Terrihabitans sp. PJ23]MDX6805068.1 MipA/OmpV family protein [Terrihabitans sp. PJ23]